jgi:protein-S-isoprenylcysteine O-methyltransferase Ste14
MKKENTLLSRTLFLRLFFILVFAVPFLFYAEFFTHILSHLTGSILPSVITHQWHIVLLNIVIFITFLLPLSFRRKVAWKEYGLVTAFFVSLFVEMYGIPLTIFFASRSLTPSSAESAEILVNFQFLGVDIAMDHAMLYATVLMILGTILIALSWITLYKKIQQEPLVTRGIYAYSRHPQYLGFLLIIFGWFIGWPTLLTAIFTPILLYTYVKVALTEEKELAHLPQFTQYKKTVPFFI